MKTQIKEKVCKTLFFGIEKNRMSSFRASTSKCPIAKSIKNVQIIGCVLAAVLVVVWFSLERNTQV
jgi:hypothetical protein